MAASCCIEYPPCIVHAVAWFVFHLVLLVIQLFVGHLIAHVMRQLPLSLAQAFHPKLFPLLQQKQLALYACNTICVTWADCC